MGQRIETAEVAHDADRREFSRLCGRGQPTRARGGNQTDNLSVCSYAVSPRARGAVLSGLNPEFLNAEVSPRARGAVFLVKSLPW